MNEDLPAYTEGLADLGGGCWAWLEPPGSWGLANSGIVVGSDNVLVVDTQNDLRLARLLQAGVHEVAGGAPVRTVVNTHGDSDHWSGNLLFEGARIISSAATLDEMTHMWLDQSTLAELADADTAFARWVRWRTEVFDYDGWRPVHPTETFSGRRTIEAAGRKVDLIEVGPAHTAGDVIVHLPDDGVVYAGDIVFAASTPMVWAGPLSRVIAACDLILELQPRVVVPGHGPIVDASGVTVVRDHLSFVLEHADGQYRAGRSPEQAYAAIRSGPYSSWPHASRAYQSIRARYTELDPQRFPPDRRRVMEIVLGDDDGDWDPARRVAGDS